MCVYVRMCVCVIIKSRNNYKENMYDTLYERPSRTKVARFHGNGEGRHSSGVSDIIVAELVMS